VSVRPGALPRLHVVTDDEVVRAPGFVARAGEILRAGGPLVALHLRHRGTGERLYALAADLVARADHRAAALIVSRRVDIALASGAAGVHLGRGAMPAAGARALLGDDAWVGLSVHGAAEVDGLDGAVDYALVGAVFPTPTHPGRPGAGLEALARAAGRTARPVLAIGGVDARRVGACLDAGAYGVAVLSAVWSARRPERRVGKLLEILEGKA
jgi:thiamine-phosphate pyrophosphorylase